MLLEISGDPTVRVPRKHIPNNGWSTRRESLKLKHVINEVMLDKNAVWIKTSKCLRRGNPNRMAQWYRVIKWLMDDKSNDKERVLQRHGWSLHNRCLGSKQAVKWRKWTAPRSQGKKREWKGRGKIESNQYLNPKLTLTPWTRKVNGHRRI